MNNLEFQISESINMVGNRSNYYYVTRLGKYEVYHLIGEYNKMFFVLDGKKVSVEGINDKGKPVKGIEYIKAFSEIGDTIIVDKFILK